MPLNLKYIKIFWEYQIYVLVLKPKKLYRYYVKKTVGGQRNNFFFFLNIFLSHIGVKENNLVDDYKDHGNIVKKNSFIFFKKIFFFCRK